MNTPLVSVIIPTYNCAKYIPEAVESIINQTYNNTEIIVVDDGSTDGTREALKPYSNRIRYIYQTNQGNARARNVGMAAAKGQYIAFLDADDRWKEFKLELQVKALENLPHVDMVFSNYSTMDEAGTVVNKSCIEHGFPIFSEYKVGIKELFTNAIKAEDIAMDSGLLSDGMVYFGNVYDKLFMGNFILPSTEVFRRTDLQFNEKYKCAVDQDFHLRFSKKSQVAYIDCSTIEYRIHRKNKLSGKQNTPQLILNTIATRLDVAGSDPEFASKNRKLINNVIAANLFRLAYYYLSIQEKKESKKYSVECLKYDRIHLKAWLVFMASFFPSKLLSSARNLKSAVSGFSGN